MTRPLESTRGVREDIGQARPFATRRQEALMALLHTTDRVGRYLSLVLEPAGVTRQQYNVLRILRGSGGALPTMEIRDRMIEEAPGITGLLNRLELKKLVHRSPCSDDGRVVRCRLSHQGKNLLAELDAAMDAADERALQGLGDAEVERLVELLDRARAAIPSH